MDKLDNITGKYVIFKYGTYYRMGLVEAETKAKFEFDSWNRCTLNEKKWEGIPIRGNEKMMKNTIIGVFDTIEDVNAAFAPLDETIVILRTNNSKLIDMVYAMRKENLND